MPFIAAAGASPPAARGDRQSAAIARGTARPTAERSREMRQVIGTGGEPRDVGIDHHLDETAEVHLGLPSELLGGLGAIADQVLDLRRAEERRIEFHVLVRIETG